MLEGLEHLVYPSCSAREAYPDPKWFGEPSVPGAWSTLPATHTTQCLLCGQPHSLPMTRGGGKTFG